jgi:hypothetical protein
LPRGRAVGDDAPGALECFSAVEAGPLRSDVAGSGPVHFGTIVPKLICPLPLAIAERSLDRPTDLDPLDRREVFPDLVQAIRIMPRSAWSLRRREDPAFIFTPITETPPHERSGSARLVLGAHPLSDAPIPGCAALWTAELDRLGRKNNAGHRDFDG